MDAILNYSKTQRTVLLIDLNPILQPEPDPYITTILSTLKTLLSFPPLNSSLFAFRLFISSLSPLLSSSRIPIPSLSLSFDRPNSTLHSLCQTLTSFLSHNDFRFSNSALPARALHVAASLRQIAHDYAWDSDSGMGSDSGFGFVKSNLVVLVSEFGGNVNSVSDFFDDDVKCFSKCFDSVKEAFDSRDIHCCWVDVKCDDECELGFGYRVFESGIRDLGWSFCLADSIVLGSAVVPFGLIYPKMVASSKIVGFRDDCRRISGQLSLQILDVSGKPLECKCFHLELVCLDKFRGNVNFIGSRKKMIWEAFGDGITKMWVEAVQAYNESARFDGSLSDVILVRECSRDKEKAQIGSRGEFFEQRVLEMLGSEMGEELPKKSVPIWHIFLSFLYREGYLALVSIINADGKSLHGILKPFTVSSALLSIIEDKIPAQGMTSRSDRAALGQSAKKTESESCGLRTDSNYCRDPIAGCQSRVVTENKGVEKKKYKKKLHDLTWNAFRKAALEDYQIDLEEICFARTCNQSKKLKFLKCWMKQIKKHGHGSLSVPGKPKPDDGHGSFSSPGKPKPDDEIPEQPNDRLTDLPEQSAQPIASCASVGDDSCTGASRIQDESALDFHSETLESFFNNLSNKIQQGLESKEVDLESLAMRLVKSSIHWLYQKYEREITSESQVDGGKPGDTSATIVAVELAKLLLRDPKALLAMHRNSNQSSHASGPNSSEMAPGNILREYELQILFRMEILQSEVGSSIEDSTKQKFVKQICLLLDTIQCHLEGGFFGDWSLDKYVRKMIKNRYSDSLADVVHKIYERMDLLLFEDEDESSNPLLNSEDSNRSWREKPDTDEMVEKQRVSEPLSLEDESHQPMKSKDQSPQTMNQEEHARKLIEAQERRQRARRFASFTSWVPDLQRVWAPKQTKATIVKPGALQKLSKRKQKRRENYDTVCETPMTGKRRSCDGRNNTDKKNHQDSMCGSVSKALFQDD